MLTRVNETHATPNDAKNVNYATYLTLVWGGSRGGREPPHLPGRVREVRAPAVVLQAIAVIAQSGLCRARERLSQQDFIQVRELIRMQPRDSMGKLIGNIYIYGGGGFAPNSPPASSCTILFSE